VLSWSFLGLAVAPIIGVFLYLSHYRKATGSQKVDVLNPQIISDLSREYIVTYAISLIGFNLFDVRQIVSFCFLILFFAFLYVKYDAVVYNPILELLNYRMFRADMVQLRLPTDSEGQHPIRKSVIIITSKRVTRLSADSISVLPMNADGDLFIEGRARKKWRQAAE